MLKLDMRCGACGSATCPIDACPLRYEYGPPGHLEAPLSSGPPRSLRRKPWSGDGAEAHPSLHPAERYPAGGKSLHAAMVEVLCNVTPSAEINQCVRPAGGIIYYPGRLDAARECLASSHEAS